MWQYYSINIRFQEVHTANCPYKSDASNREMLGAFLTPEKAVEHAKEKGYAKAAARCLCCGKAREKQRKN